MTKFNAFAVDAFGAPLARYDLAASEAEAAEQEARQYLERHRVIEFGRTTIGGSHGSSGSLISRTRDQPFGFTFGRMGDFRETPNRLAVLATASGFRPKRFATASNDLRERAICISRRSSANDIISSPSPSAQSPPAGGRSVILLLQNHPDDED